MTDRDVGPCARGSDEIQRQTSAISGYLNGRASAPDESAAVAEPAWLALATRRAVEPEDFVLAKLWHEVAAGTWRFRATFSTAERHFVLMKSVSAQTPSRSHTRNLEILRRVLLGQLPKAVASEMDIAISTAAGAMKYCLNWMGLSGRAASAPMVLTVAARAAHDPKHPPALGRLARVSTEDDSYWLIGIRRPELEFPVDLSPAESLVIRELLSGKTHAEISEQRSVSCRTVANQLAAASRKLGVSGRAAILQCVISHSLQTQFTVACDGPLAVSRG